MAVNKFTGAPGWDDLRIFRVLAEMQTLSATARHLGVTHATVARRTDRLEAQFGTALFEKRPTGYVLTAVGAELARMVAEMDQVSLGIRRLQQAERRQLGTVRISAPRSITDSFLVPNMGSIRSSLRGIELTILTETRLVSVAKWETDIALRLGRPENAAVLARKVGTIRYRLRGIDHTAADALIGYPPDDPGAEARWLERHAAGRPFSFRSNSQVAQYAAAKAGVGIALLPGFLADGLRIVDEASYPADREVFLLSRREALRQPAVRASFDALIEIFRSSWPEV